jgi:hypothetical protein
MSFVPLEWAIWDNANGVPDPSTVQPSDWVASSGVWFRLDYTSSYPTMPVAGTIVTPILDPSKSYSLWLWEGLTNTVGKGHFKMTGFLQYYIDFQSYYQLPS